MFQQSTKNEHWYFITRTEIQKSKARWHYYRQWKKRLWQYCQQQRVLTNQTTVRRFSNRFFVKVLGWSHCFMFCQKRTFIIKFILAYKLYKKTKWRAASQVLTPPTWTSLECLMARPWMKPFTSRHDSLSRHLSDTLDCIRAKPCVIHRRARTVYNSASVVSLIPLLISLFHRTSYFENAFWEKKVHPIKKKRYFTSVRHAITHSLGSVFDYPYCWQMMLTSVGTICQI